MRFIVFFALFQLFLNPHLQSQTCLPDGIIFHTQQEVDDFQINYPGCTTILGDVSMYESGITNLSGLINVTAIKGFFSITQQPTLLSLNGLNNLTEIGGSFILSPGSTMSSLHGLENLRTVGQNFYFGLSYLQSFSGLENLEKVGYNFELIGEPVVTSLEPLNNLVSVGNDLRIEVSNFAPSSSLVGLKKLSRVGGNLRIIGDSIQGEIRLDSLRFVGKSLTLGVQNCAAFHFDHLDSVGQLIMSTGAKDLSGFPNLRYSRDGLFLQNCLQMERLNGLSKLTRMNGLSLIYIEKLRSLSGLEHVDTLYGAVDIKFNPSLLTLQGLNGVKTFAGLMTISDNPVLSDCSIEMICRELGPVVVSNNAPGCNNLSEIPVNCRFPAFISVLLDNNNNCIPDSVDTPARGIQVQLSNLTQQVIAQSDSIGIASLFPNRWEYSTLDLPHFPNNNWGVCQDSIFTSPPGLLDTLYQTFLLHAIRPCPELETTLSLPSFFRGCLVASPMEVKTQNIGAIPALGVQVAVVLAPGLELVSAQPPISAQNGDTLFFEIGELKPFATDTVKLSVKTSCDTLLLGHTLCIEAFSAMENACVDTTQAHSEIKLAAHCLGDTLVRFTLKNIGNAPTQSLHSYKIFKNETLVQDNTFDLPAQQSLEINLPADGATWRMEATKFNDGAQTAVAIENCAGLTPGLITSFWLDHGPLEYDFDCRQVIGAYDPNLKSAVPTGLVNLDYLIAPNQPIRYTIDFQNTGSDTAYRVLLRDVLPIQLDLSTFKPLSSSHPCSWQIRDRMLEVLYLPIALPDSNVNEAASHGYFSFEVGQQPDLPDGTTFLNRANIVFDFNPPIQTNDVLHSIGELSVRVQEPQAFAKYWRILGNPMLEEATFEAIGPVGGSKQFVLYDATGHLLRAAQFSGQTFAVQRGDLVPGIYFFSISQETGGVFTGKIIVSGK